jgi:hypothetical protein
MKLIFTVDCAVGFAKSLFFKSAGTSNIYAAIVVFIYASIVSLVTRRWTIDRSVQHCRLMEHGSARDRFKF